MNPGPVAQAEMREKALGPLGLPLGGVYLGTNEKEGELTLLCGAGRSTFTVLFYNPNYARFNMTLEISTHMVNFSSMRM